MFVTQSPLISYSFLIDLERLNNVLDEFPAKFFSSYF